MSIDESEWPVDGRFVARLRVRLAEYAACKGVRTRADDVVQETLVVLWTKYSHLRDETEITRVSYGICRLKVLEALRAPRAESLDDDLPVADPRPGVDLTIVQEERRRMLREAIGRLGARCQRLFRLRLQGRSTKEIAAVMDAPPGTIHVWEHRCRQQLLADFAWAPGNG